MKLVSTFIASFILFGFGIVAAEPARASAGLPTRPGTTGAVDKPLAAFTYRSVKTKYWESDLGRQKTLPVCRDLLGHLNHLRSDDLFNVDGTLVRESEKIRSVRWETLDKDKYRDGFTSVANVTPPVRAARLKNFADEEWFLQRTQARLDELPPGARISKEWIYRLVNKHPLRRDFDDPASKLEVPTWFPLLSEEWIGDEHGKFSDGVSTMLHGGRRQWILYGDAMYAIRNSTAQDDSGAIPKYLKLDVYRLKAPLGRPLLLWTCAFHARIPK